MDAETPRSPSESVEASGGMVASVQTRRNQSAEGRVAEGPRRLAVFRPGSTREIGRSAARLPPLPPGRHQQC